MVVITAVDFDKTEFVAEDDDILHLDLVLHDMDDQEHLLRFAKPQLVELAMFFRGIQQKFPGALGGH